jgi:hypothetical protein
MSDKYYQNWEEVDNNWEAEIRLWEEVYIIIGEVTNYGAGRNPFEEQQIREQLEKLEESKKQKLVEIMILLGNEEYREKKKKNEKIRITVNDVKTIARDYLKIEIG